MWEIRRTAAQRCTMLTNQMAQAVGITKDLKTTDQMSYVQQMNTIDAESREINNEKLISRMIERYIQHLTEHVRSHEPDFGAANPS